ncbi:hypothetical protein ACJZTR_03310 [Neorickettsia risticii]|nr:hypothetical protein [Neorickettsia risticii]
MRLPFLLFAILAVSAGFATANPIMEYFLTMSYVEGGMEPCASVVERLGDSNKRTQFLRVLAPTLAAIQSVGKNSIDTEQITKTLESAVLYCNACPSATFGMALMNAARNSDSTGWCKDRPESKLPRGAGNTGTSATLPSNAIEKRSDTQVHNYNGNNSNNKQSTRSKGSPDRSNDVQIIE